MHCIPSTLCAKCFGAECTYFIYSRSKVQAKCLEGGENEREVYSEGRGGGEMQVID